MRNGLK